ncbi:unnamed protein product, partial [Prunus brigantina]
MMARVFFLCQTRQSLLPNPSPFLLHKISHALELQLMNAPFAKKKVIGNLNVLYSLIRSPNHNNSSHSNDLQQMQLFHPIVNFPPVLQCRLL